MSIHNTPVHQTDPDDHRFYVYEVTTNDAEYVPLFTSLEWAKVYLLALNPGLNGHQVFGIGRRGETLLIFAGGTFWQPVGEGKEG